MAVAMMVISVGLVIWAYVALLGSLKPGYQARVLAELRTRAERGAAAAQYALGTHYYRGVGVTTNWQEAVYWYREAAEGGHGGAQLALGLCYLQGKGTTQSYEASIPWLRQAAVPDNQKVRYYFGLDYPGGFGVKRGMVDSFQYLAWLGPLALAAAGFTVVVGFVRKRTTFFDPALCMAIVLAVGALSWRWRHDGVEVLWQSIRARDPNCYFACKHLGYALVQNGQEDKSLTYFQKAVELEPDDAEVHNNLGNVRLQNGQWDGAIRQYQEALRLKPDFTEASNNLVVVLGLKEAAAKQPTTSTKP
jgi:TPR repeat protein